MCNINVSFPVREALQVDTVISLISLDKICFVMFFNNPVTFRNILEIHCVHL